MKLAWQRSVLAVVVLVAVALAGCQGDRGRAGVQTLLVTTDLAAGADCEAGGVRVETGPDQNRNRTLDAEEVAVTSVICRPPSGLVNVTSLPPSEECPFGSTLITSGVDANGDGVLAEAELAASELFCAPRESDFEGLVFLAPVYVSSSPKSGLFRARADGSGFMPLAATRDAATGITSFALSPDKTRVAFKAQMDADSPVALFVVSLIDGEPAREVSGTLFEAAAEVGDYAWSPDGSRIAFIATGGSMSALYVVRPDGTLRVRLDQPDESVVTSSKVMSLAWAPGGDLLAFFGAQDTLNKFELYTVPVAGGVAPTKISCGAKVHQLYAWSPDGAHLAFFENTSGSAYGLRLGTPGEACIAGDPIATLVHNSSNTPLSLAWQPVAADAILLFGGGDPVDVTIAKVYVYNPTSGGSPAQVGCDLEAEEKSRDAAWAPDGGMIAYRSNADQTVPGYRLYLASPSGEGSCTAVSAGPSTGFEVAGFEWSPTSELLLYNTAKIDGTSHRGELYVVPEGGGAASVLHGNVCVKAASGVAECGQTFAFAADGRAAFIGQSSSSGSLSLFVATPGAGAGTAVSGETITGLWNLAWAPDGGRIAFIGREGEDALAHLYTVTPEGEGLVQLTPDDMPASMQLPDYEAKYSW